MTGSAAVCSVGFALWAIMISGMIWQILLRDQSVWRPWRQIVPLYMVCQFGKYLPGNIGQFVGRAVVAKRIGIPVPVTLATMITEAIWGVGTALGWGAISMRLFFPVGMSALPRWASGSVMFLSFVALLASPWLSVTMLKRFFPTLVRRAFGPHDIVPPKLLTALGVSAMYGACFLAMGAMLQWQARFLFQATDVPLIQCSGCFALAWLAGYLLPGAPAGIGVREFVMVVMFTPLLGEGTAVALGVTSRMATTLADVLALLTGWVAFRTSGGYSHDGSGDD